MGTTLHDLSYGLGVAVHPVNLLAGALGVIVGTTIGVIPALGPTQGAALLLPIVFKLLPFNLLPSSFVDPPPPKAALPEARRRSG